LGNEVELEFEELLNLGVLQDGGDGRVILFLRGEALVTFGTVLFHAGILLAL
jgi:hypothetical protein